MIYSDPSLNGARYVKNVDGTKTFLNSFPTTTSGNPVTFTDSYGNVYTVYSDSANNKYVTYTDSKGRYFITDNGSKSYLPQTIPTTSIPQTTFPTTTLPSSNTGSFVVPGTNTGSTMIPTTPTTTVPSTGGFGGAPMYIFTDSTGGNRYYLNSNNNRVYLTLDATSSTSQTYTDPQGNRFTISKDPSNSNSYTQVGTNIRQYVTGYPTTTVGSPVNMTDNLGTRYTI